MEMENRSTPRKHFITPILYFGLTTVVAIVLLITTLVIWLSELTGSVIVSTLVVGGFCALLSLVIYQLSIRDIIEDMRNKLQTVYEVANVLQIGYKWVSDKLLQFLKPQEK